MFMQRNMKDSPQSSQPVSWTVSCVVVAVFIERSPCKSMQKRSAQLGSSTFDHVFLWWDC